MKFILIGNRYHVFSKMLSMNLKINHVFATRNSYLERYLQKINYSYTPILSKEKLINDIKALDFDCLVSNGCPYILPVSKIKKSHQQFINIHPSLLPDLRGEHPINGALLLKREHGVTCHHMDDGVDTGPIITNIKIPITGDIELGLLYQLTFIAEGELFSKAQSLDFKVGHVRCDCSNPIYYSKRESDLEITASDNIDEVLAKIRAFGINSLCARFYKGGKAYKILSAKIINNPILNALFPSAKDDEVICSYDSKVLVKKYGKYIQFEMFDLEDDIEVGDQFFDFP